MKNIFPRKGQSLLETMVALSILVVGFLGLISLLSQSFHIGRVTGDEMRATYLAEEGIELTKNIVEDNMFDPSPSNQWLGCFNFGSNVEMAFEIDFATAIRNGGPNKCPVNPLQRWPTPQAIQGAITAVQSSLQPLYFTPSTQAAGAALYGFHNSFSAGDNATATGFQRVIFMTQVSAAEIEVDSVVLWPGNNQVILTDHFYHWFPSK